MFRLYIYLFMTCIWLNATAASLSFTLSPDLLKGLPRHYVSMNYSRAYLGSDMTFETVLMKSLLDKLLREKIAIVEFIAKDGFSVYIPLRLMLSTNPKSSIAYLAIEPQKSWPLLSNGLNESAGPYQLIWTNPRLSHISDEYWAWSVTKIVLHKKLPAHQLIAKPKTNKIAILKGHRIYISHCASCHTINHIGKAVIGPDLGGKNNPLKYYGTPTELAKFIRNPSAFRPGRMSGSSYDGMTDEQLQQLIDYFAYLNLAPG